MQVKAEEPRFKVIVFGGEHNKIDQLNGDYGDGAARVTAFPGTDPGAARVAERCRGGGCTHVVLLKWASHGQAERIGNAARAGKVKIVRFQQSPASLKRHLETEWWSLLGAPVPPERMLEQMGPLLPPDETPPFMPMRCGQVPLELPVEEESKVSEQPDTPPAAEPARTWRGASRARVLEVMMLEPDRRWRVKDIAELLDAQTRVHHSSVHQTVARMWKLGQLEKRNKTYRIAGDKTKEAPSLAAKPEQPKATGELVYLVLDENGPRTVSFFKDRDQAIAALERTPGGRIFRELKTRMRVEVDE